MTVSAQELVELSSKLADESDVLYKNVYKTFCEIVKKHEAEDKTFAELAIDKDKEVLEKLPGMRRDIVKSIQKLYDAKHLNEIACRINIKLIVSTCYVINGYLARIRILEDSKRYFDRAANYARGIDPEYYLGPKL
jgi:hypothetical protein